MKAVVTGAAGFIGSRLVAALLERGDSVVGVDCLNSSYDPELKRHRIDGFADRPGFEFVYGNLNELPLADILVDADVVFHLAGQPGVRKSWGSNFGMYVRDNIEATQRLLDAARAAPRLRRLVYASSSSIYGNAEAYPTRETDRPLPLSPYGVSKLAGEHLVNLYAHEFGVPGVSLRYFTVYGPGQRPDMAFSRFIGAALDDAEIELYGDGLQIRDFTFVDDVVDANLLVATAELAPGSIFNVTGGSGATVNEVLAMIEQIHGSALRIVRRETVPGDVFRTGGSSEAFTATVGWQPSISLHDGIARQYEWAASARSLWARL